MGAVSYPLQPGPPIVPSNWDSYHDMSYPGYQSYAYERDWCAIKFSLPVPLDRLMTKQSLDWMFCFAFWTGIKTGGPLRALLWYRTRISGIYNYEMYLEYANHRVDPGAVSYAIWGCLVMVVKDMNGILDYELSESGVIAGPTPPIPEPPPPPPTPSQVGDLAVAFACEAAAGKVSASLSWIPDSTQTGLWIDMPINGVLDVVEGLSPTQSTALVTGLPSNAQGNFGIVSSVKGLIAHKVIGSPDCSSTSPPYTPPDPTPPTGGETTTNWMPIMILGGAALLLFIIMRGGLGEEEEGEEETAEEEANHPKEDLT